MMHLEKLFEEILLQFKEESKNIKDQKYVNIPLKLVKYAFYR